MVIAITPAVVRRLVDLLVGGTLLVQVTLAAPGAPPGHRSGGPYGTVAAASALSRSDGPAATGDLALPSREAARLRRPADKKEPVEARPTLRRSAAPLPPWLGGGPSTAAPGHRAGAGGYTVESGDTLWDIAAAHLVPAERSAATIHRYWQQVYRANRSVVGADPDVIHPGTRLDVTPYRRDRR
jgi:resuscitation-promoting factor RpfA